LLNIDNCLYSDFMSEFNYTKCSKPFQSQQEARDFMLEKKFKGSILAREDGNFTAVCPTYPEGYYPDAVTVEVIEEKDFKSLQVVDADCC